LSQSTSSVSAVEFIQQVLAERPAIAVFDCDGTLWSGDSGSEFFYWEMEHGFIAPELIDPIKHRYNEYLAGRVDELSICGEMIQINHGVDHQRLCSAAREFFAERIAPRIFPEMLELTRRLASQGCELWAVSSTNNWVVEAGAEVFGIPQERVLAATLAVENGLITQRLLRVPTDELKQEAIEQVIARPVDAHVQSTRASEIPCTTTRCWRRLATPTPSTPIEIWRGKRLSSAGRFTGLREPGAASSGQIAGKPVTRTR
jgi:phosphoserine phosphatase